GVLHEHVEVAILVEDARVEELVLELVAAAPPVRLHQVGVGIARVLVLVEELQERVGRRVVEAEVVLLDVFAVVSFAVCEPEEPFLQNRVLAVPQGESEAEPLLLVRNPSETILAPAIRPRTSVIVGEKVPRVSVGTVILAHRPPLSVRAIRSPLLPRHVLRPRCLKATVLRAHRCSSLVVRFCRSSGHPSRVAQSAETLPHHEADAATPMPLPTRGPAPSAR